MKKNKYQMDDWKASRIPTPETYCSKCNSRIYKAFEIYGCHGSTKSWEQREAKICEHCLPLTFGNGEIWKD